MTSGRRMRLRRRARGQLRRHSPLLLCTTTYLYILVSYYTIQYLLVVDMYILLLQQFSFFLLLLPPFLSPAWITQYKIAHDFMSFCKKKYKHSYSYNLYIRNHQNSEQSLNVIPIGTMQVQGLFTNDVSIFLELFDPLPPMSAFVRL